MSHIVKALAVAALAWCGMTAGAHAADYVAGPYKEIGECSDQRFLSKISERFRYQVKNVPDLPDVSIQDFHDIRETRYIPESEEWPISRRYCGATVVLSDGHKRDIWYLIEGRMGFVGIGQNVEFCVSGFDRWYVYNGRCRVLR